MSDLDEEYIRTPAITLIHAVRQGQCLAADLALRTGEMEGLTKEAHVCPYCDMVVLLNQRGLLPQGY